MGNRKGVKINVYVETEDVRTVGLQRINPDRPWCGCSCNRRTGLLAYAQELRKDYAASAPTNAQHVESSFKNSAPKQNKWRWGDGMGKMREFLMGGGMKMKSKSKWGYVPIDTEYYSYYSDGEDFGKKNRRSRTKGRRRQSPFCKKLRGWLKEISMSWRVCRDGHC